MGNGFLKDDLSRVLSATPDNFDKVVMTCVCCCLTLYQKRRILSEDYDNKNELREESEHGVVVTKTSTNLLGGLRVEQIQLNLPLISNSECSGAKVTHCGIKRVSLQNLRNHLSL
jgi:hypothetical protein